MNMERSKVGKKKSPGGLSIARAYRSPGGLAIARTYRSPWGPSYSSGLLSLPGSLLQNAFDVLPNEPNLHL